MLSDSQVIIRALEKYPQPTLAYDTAGIKSELELLRSHLRRSVRGKLQETVLVSLKANPNRELLKWLAEQNVGAEISSIPEYEIAQRAGFRLISATSPGLSVRNIADLCAGAVRVNIDNPSQLQGVPAGAEIGLRLCLPLDVTLDSQSSAYSRFGVMLDSLSFREALRTFNGKVIRVHGHFRDIGNAQQLSALASRVVAAAKEFPNVREINLGGGMTRLYKDGAQAGDAWDQCAPIFDELKPDSRLFVEPGAQILTSHGYLGTRVVSITERPDGRTQIVVDASKWNLVCWSEYELLVPESNEEGTVADVVGPTCYEKDVWLTGVQLPAVHVGQQLIFRGLGAYVASLARKMHGLPLPNEVLI